jgi:hypothetical protein
MIEIDTDDEEERIPNVADPIWIEMSAPVLEFLSQPRDWSEIRPWADARNLNPMLLGHCVAWLEEKGLAMSFFRDSKVTWVATSIRAPKEDVDEPTP